MNRLRATAIRFGTWAGMIAPVIFVTVFLVAGAIEPGYNVRTMYVSELSLGPYGWIQILNFVALGPLLLIFTHGVAAKIHKNRWSKIGVGVFIVLGVCFLLSGPFRVDPRSVSPADWSARGTIHQGLGSTVFVFMPISLFFFFLYFKTDDQWRFLARPTLWLLALVLILITLLKAAQLTTGILADNVGYIQRSVIILYLVWIFVFAYHLRVVQMEHD
jgi:hypothetical protein